MGESLLYHDGNRKLQEAFHSRAIADRLEQVTMQVSSWERRSRSLEQSSETDVDQQTDVTQSTRDTEDVFKEMIAKRDFAWQRRQHAVISDVSPWCSGPIVTRDVRKARKIC